MKEKLFVVVLLWLIGTSMAKADDFTIDLSPGFSTTSIGMSNYVSRGISQTDNRPAIDVVSTYKFANGLFGSVGAVNSIEGNGNVESDLIVGYATKLSSSWFYQTSVYYTAYPGSSGYNNLNTVELQNIVNYVQDWGRLVGAFTFQPPQGHNRAFYTYMSTGADFNLPHEFTLGFRVGYNNNSNYSRPDYTDWDVILSRPITAWASWSIHFTGSTEYAAVDQHLIVVIQIGF